MDFEMSFTNTTENPFECCYSMPVEPDCIISSLKAQVKDKEVSAEIKAKSQAKEKFEDAVAGGKAAFYAETKTVNQAEVLELKVGNLLPADTCIIKIQMVKDLLISGSSYMLQIPPSFYPDYTKMGMDKEDAGYEFSFEAIILANDKISYLSLPDGSESNVEDDGKKVSFTTNQLSK
jgi:hypothetical protein